jgi:hypothetical protein
MAHAYHITPAKDTNAEFARLAALNFEPWAGEVVITSERWKETFMAVQIAQALMEFSKDGLTAAIADDSVALGTAFDQLTFQADFLDEMADLLRTAQARLLIATAASVHRKAA